MRFNIYLDDETGEQLNHASKKSGESRNALIRRAVGEWLKRHRALEWPNEVLKFKGMANATPFEASRTKLKVPPADPLA